MRIPWTLSALFGALALASAPADAQIQLSPQGEPIPLSSGVGAQTPDLNQTAKTKLVRLSNSGSTHGRLISVFGDAWAGADHPNGHLVYDVKADAERPARDIFVRYSDDDGLTWSDTINIANTAALSSMTTQWQGEDTEARAFHGDSDKPNVFNAGNFVVVSWVDKYCPGDLQQSVTYVERDLREIPYSCVYTARSHNGGTSWQPAQQLTDGSRDAKQDVNRGNGSKAWVVTWQEDPAGLSLGEGDGPGHGASGATVAHGTDIWYSYVKTSYPEGGTPADSDFAKGVPFSGPVRITNNWTRMEDKRNDGNEIQAGQEGAARANTALVGGTVVVAYEETKGTEGVDEGKYIRYHSFPFAKPPSALPGACLTEINGEPTDCTAGLPPNLNQVERMGCILSKPEQSGRRVRMLPQGIPGESGTKLFIFWRQGEYDAGGPADIMGRYSSDLLDLNAFVPALNVPDAGVVGGCYIRGDDDAEAMAEQGAFANAPALNLSAESPLGGDLTADSDDNAIEDARAHRGYIRGDTIVLGYSYTPDQVLARATDMEHYNFWIRRSFDGGATWDAPQDLTSELIEEFVNANPDDRFTNVTQIDVKEPRLVKTPGNGPATCPSGDPDDPTTRDPSECNNPLGFVLAGGLVENTYEHLGDGEELDLFITRSLDAGDSFEAPVFFAATAAEEFESQIRMTPSLDKVFTVWNQKDAEGQRDGYFLALIPEAVPVVQNRSRSSGSLNGNTLWWLCILYVLWSSRRLPKGGIQ